jgi:hypothetical protein
MHRVYLKGREDPIRIKRDAAHILIKDLQDRERGAYATGYFSYKEQVQLIIPEDDVSEDIVEEVENLKKENEELKKKLEMAEWSATYEMKQRLDLGVELDKIKKEV